ncbi:MarR family transcriptional regulator [Sphingomonas sp. AOB5]|uniref:MarR family winged helix-turn-helix transcriptional regulator n=1 Tax=Sphingomonas sp. AOB5 TaxID=3034017 RepID=UPI0023F65E5B|nr:MarR family transcriptional regulator [Sphingomonas sp. AOB5]MDF7775520.1 MarR family transcriptional regulator [Sphingomonas sp. AOB5]
MSRLPWSAARRYIERVTERRPPDVIDNLVGDWRTERPRTKPDAMHVVGRIIRLGHIYESEVARLLQPYGLAYSDFDVLATLRRSGAPYEQAPSELQRNVVLTSGAMTACLRRLEAAGLVSRSADPDDRRRLSARLTPAGYDLVEQLIDQRFALATDAIAGLTADQAEAMKLLLRRLLDE